MMCKPVTITACLIMISTLASLSACDNDASDQDESMVSVEKTNAIPDSTGQQDDSLQPEYSGIPVDSIGNQANDVPKQNLSLTGRGTLYLQKDKSHSIWFYPNEFVGPCSRSECTKDSPDSVYESEIVDFVNAFLVKEGHVAAELNPWLCSYYVEIDSIDSWYGKNMIQGQAIHINDIGGALLEDYITIYFNHRPSDEEVNSLVSEFELLEYPNMHLQAYESDGLYFLPAKLAEPRADVLIKTCHLIRKKEFVSWVQNHIHTEEPILQDLDKKQKSKEEL